jgi:hypothetical protein
MPFEALLAFALIALVVGGFAYLVHRAAVQRREALAALAAELGATFEPGKDYSLPAKFEHFELFARGKNRHAYNTVRGNADLGGWQIGFTMGDYRYTVEQGDNDTTYTLSYALVHLPYDNVPDLFIRPEGLLDKIAGAIGFDDIDFESEEFSSRFHVSSNDKRFAYDVLHPRMMEFLLDIEPPPIALASGSLLMTRGNTEWDQETFRAHLRWSREFFSRWPDHVRAMLR